ncbi:MAG: hypothetical protein I8H93_19075 [Pseudomonadales bacterium]|nr:hypothetical protein [Pseudomonadales bacterium]MBH2078098.1 hypothetical protein [Pseudomonadales bacterium]
MPIKNSETTQHTNFYICHTPYHFYISSLIAEQYFSNDTNIAIIEGDSEIKGQSKFKETIRLEYIGGSVFKTYSKIEKAIDLISTKITNVSTNRIFLSDIAWPLCNRVFFENSFNQCSFNFFSDGVAAYLDKKHSTKQSMKDKFKSLLSKLCITSKYTSFKGHALGYDHSKAKGFYLPSPGLIKYKVGSTHNIDLLPPSFQTKASNKKNVLFLDQPLWLVLKDSWPDKIDKTLSYVKSRYPEHNLYFKKHHRSRNKESELFTKHGFLQLESNYCIEELVAERKYDVVISFYSSALLHLKWILTPDTALINLTDDEIIKKLKINNETTDLYKSNEILTEFLT